MDTDTTTRRSTRRAVLGAALGGAAAVAAASVARPLGVKAADNGNAIIGAVNQGNNLTTFENLDPAETSLMGTHSGNGSGVAGMSVSGAGVIGRSTESVPANMSDTATAVWGASGDISNVATNTSETGIYGFADSSGAAAGVWGDSLQGIGVIGTGDWGVYGTGSTGVVGDVGTGGVGVYGYAGSGTIPVPSTGVGVYARAGTTSQTALQVVGKVKFSRSGRTSIGSSSQTKTISMTGVTTSSYIIATMQTSVSGVYVRAVVPASGSFKIVLSKSPGKTVVVGYLVIN